MGFSTKKSSFDFSEMSLKLKEINRTDWHILNKMYADQKKEPLGFGLWRNFIHWTTLEPNLNVKAFSLGEDWQLDGTFIIVDAEMELPHVYVNTLSEDSQQILQTLNSLDIKSDFFLNTMPKCFFSIIEKYILQQNFSLNDVKYFDGNWYHLSNKEALKFDTAPPEGIKLQTLKEQNVEVINGVWPLRGPGSENYINNLIKFNDNIGAFDDNDKLVAWCLRTSLGALGNIHVVDTHRRLGLGSLLVSYMSRHIALKNEEIVAPVKQQNTASRLMFEKLGFKAINEVFCVEIPRKSTDVLCK